MKLLKLFMALFFVGNLFSAPYATYQKDIRAYSKELKAADLAKDKSERLKSVNSKIEILQRIKSNAISDEIYIEKDGMLIDKPNEPIPSLDEMSLDEMSSDDERTLSSRQLVPLFSNVRTASQSQAKFHRGTGNFDIKTLLTENQLSASEIQTKLKKLNDEKDELITYKEIFWKKWGNFMKPVRETAGKVAFWSSIAALGVVAGDIYVNRFSAGYNDARLLQNVTSLLATIAILSHSLRE
ncbi:MAG: hypothetical protein P4L22_03480 [Candidatus Babeliales bacterium]|nr:hypothetical protein [Candidatus Babeliales bacterium]